MYVSPPDDNVWWERRGGKQAWGNLSFLVPNVSCRHSIGTAYVFGIKIVAGTAAFIAGRSPCWLKTWIDLI